MDQIDKNTLIQCADLIIRQAAKLRMCEKYLGEIAPLQLPNAYETEVGRYQLLLERMKTLPPRPSSDQETFDTLRKILDSVTNPSL